MRAKSAGASFIAAFFLSASGCGWPPIPFDDIFVVDDYTFEEPSSNGCLFYVDPENGSDDGDGSAENPWRTLQRVIEDGKIEFYAYSEAYNTDSALETVHPGAPVRGGDTLILKSGYHGHVSLHSFIFSDWLTIRADDGATPVLSQFKLEGAFRNIYLRGLTVRKDSYTEYENPGENYWESEAVTYNTDACLYLGSSDFYGDGRSVKVKDLVLKTVDDVSSWTADDWVQRAAGGASLRDVRDVEIVDCVIENVSMGAAIEYGSRRVYFEGNTIKNYSVDGARIIGDNVYFAYNAITDCYDVDDNHDDAIQSYSRGADGSVGTGVIKNVILRGNLIVASTDPNNELAGNPQGIGCFDGFFENWVVENNVVVTSHYHGISFYGMTDSVILNNTVVDQDGDDDPVPWILVTAHKNGTESSDCVVANNIVSGPLNAGGENVTARDNFVFGGANYGLLVDYFKDPDRLDFHLLDNERTRSGLVNRGKRFSDYVSSSIDRDRYERSGVPDLGAYELRR